MNDERKILVGGGLLVTILYVVPSILGSDWLGLLLALIGSIGFLIALYKIGKKNFSKINSQNTILTIFSLLIISTVLSFSIDYYKANYQRELLRTIRVSIDESILENNSRTELLKIYRQYRLSENKEDASIVEIATEFYGNRLGENNVLLSEYEESEDDFNILFHKDLESDSFTIYSVAKHSRSWDNDFINRDGSIGKLQTKATVIKEGVRYEREN